MKICFHLGSPIFNEVNTITFFGIIDKSQFEFLKSSDKDFTFDDLNNNKNWLFNSSGEKNYTVSDYTISDEPRIYPASDLTFYISSKYSSLNDLFEDDKYLKWKKMITNKYPDLLDQFANAEKEAQNREELYRIVRVLDEEKTSRYSFHINDTYIKSLQERATKLRGELYPEKRAYAEYKSAGKGYCI